MLIQALNAVIAATTVVTALVALRRPALLSGSGTPAAGEIFYAQMYAARAVPLGVAAGALPLIYAGPAVRLVLAAAALVQVGDILIGVARRT